MKLVGNIGAPAAAMTGKLAWRRLGAESCSDSVSPSASSVQAKKLMTNAFFGSMDLFHPQRWHMCTPSLMDWSALTMCHKVGAISLETSGALEEAGYAFMRVVTASFLVGHWPNKQS